MNEGYSGQFSDKDVLFRSLPLYGCVDISDFNDKLIDRLISFLRYDIIEVPKNSNLTIAEYLLENGEIDDISELYDYVTEIVRDIDESDYANTSYHAPLSYLIYGDDYLVSM